MKFLKCLIQIYFVFFIFRLLNYLNNYDKPKDNFNHCASNASSIIESRHQLSSALQFQTDAYPSFLKLFIWKEILFHLVFVKLFNLCFNLIC